MAEAAARTGLAKRIGFLLMSKGFLNHPDPNRSVIAVACPHLFVPSGMGRIAILAADGRHFPTAGVSERAIWSEDFLQVLTAFSGLSDVMILSGCDHHDDPRDPQRREFRCCGVNGSRFCHST
jgi:hypothetical protein